MKITIWNEGEDSIDGDDILKPIIIRMPTSTIEYVKILKAPREFCELELGVTNAFVNHLADGNLVIFNLGGFCNSFEVKWRTLEKNDGMLLDIFYLGDSNAPVKLDGTLEGPSRPHQVGSDPKHSFSGPESIP